MESREFRIGSRPVGREHPPLVIAEIGINHEGDIDKALRMVDDAFDAGCECVKFQCHVVEDEMVPNDVVPANTSESIWDIISRCALSEPEERRIKDYVESKGMIYLCTPFSRAAADRLADMGVVAFKIGSGECNNYPLIEHVAAFGRPVVLSTGMNDVPAIRKTIDILSSKNVPTALLHCTSIYPTPNDKIRLGAMRQLMGAFPERPVGLSDHSVTIYPCLGAAALGACILERHFTSSRDWPGPDIPISMDPSELAALIRGSRIIHEALGGEKTVLPEEQPTIDFAYACVVAIRDIEPGEPLTMDNVWVKRPGTGDIPAEQFSELLDRKARTRVRKDEQIRWSHLE